MSAVLIDHPKKDGSLPSYVHPVLVAIEDDLERAYDCWERLRGKKRSYLTQEPGEPDDAYRMRLDRAVFADFFRDAITGFAGVLSRFQLKAPPPSFDRAQDNIDMGGNSVQAFFLAADCQVMRDGGTAILVEMPRDLPDDAGQEQAEGRRPYVVSYPRRAMVSWRRSVNPITGQEDLEQVVFLEMHEKNDASSYGVEIVPRYRVVGRGWWKVIELRKQKNGRYTVEEEGSGQFLDHRKQPLTYCPVVWYPPMKAGFGEGDMPLAQVVEWSFLWFRKHSDLDWKDHMCNLPVPVEEGGLPPAPGEKERPLVVGPNSVVRLQIGGKFYWAEPNSSSLRETREQLGLIEDMIRQQTLAFLFGGVAKTATQAGLEGAQTQASITTLVQQKASVIQQVYRIWCDYTGETLQVEAGISVSGTIFDRPLNAQDVAQMTQLVEALLISRQSAIEELQRAGVNRATVSAREELQRIEAEQRDLARMMGPAEGDYVEEEDDMLPSGTDLVEGGPGGRGGADAMAGDMAGAGAFG